jgi:hypothetical protein
MGRREGGLLRVWDKAVTALYGALNRFRPRNHGQGVWSVYVWGAFHGLRRACIYGVRRRRWGAEGIVCYRIEVWDFGNLARHMLDS